MFRNLVFRIKWALVIMGVVLLAAGIYYFVMAHKTPYDINLIDDSEIKAGMLVEGDIYGNYGAYEETYTTRYGVKESSTASWYYVIPVANESFMGLSVNAKQYGNQFELQSEQTYDYLTEATDQRPMIIHVKGKISKMDKKDQELYNEYLADIGFTNSEISQYCLPLYIKNQSFEGYLALLLSGAGCLIVGILLIVLLRKKA